MTDQIKVYDGKVFGAKVSGYGLKHGYLDYRALSQIIGGSILNNYIMEETHPEDWELVSGKDCFGLDESGEECDPFSDECVYVEEYQVYQYHIISESAANFLHIYTDEIVYHHHDYDLYLWGITHFGTSWDYILTDIKIGK